MVASNDADAIAVAEPHVMAHAAQFLRPDTRNTSGPFAEKLTQWGLPVFDTVTSMSLDGPWLVGKDEQPAAGPMISALINQALSGCISVQASSKPTMPLISVNSCRPKVPYSRPFPDCL